MPSAPAGRRTPTHLTDTVPLLRHTCTRGCATMTVDSCHRWTGPHPARHMFQPWTATTTNMGVSRALSLNISLITQPSCTCCNKSSDTMARASARPDLHRSISTLQLQSTDRRLSVPHRSSTVVGVLTLSLQPSYPPGLCAVTLQTPLTESCVCCAPSAGVSLHIFT